MIRLRNKRTGVVVRVDDDLASRLGPEWEAVAPPDQPAPKPRTRRK